MTLRHRLSIRVYYEDTDFSGRVYHASYVRFFERGRTEWLRALGFGRSELSGADGVIFVVRRLAVEYLAPALMDDLLVVESDASVSRGASIEFEQRVMREEQCLAEARVGVVTLKSSRVIRPPRELIDRMERARASSVVDGSIQPI